MVRSPFPPLGIKPVYLRADCRYPEDQGTWYILEVEGGSTPWAWRSDLQSPIMPAPRDDESFLDNRIVALPPWIGALGYVACA